MRTFAIIVAAAGALAATPVLAQVGTPDYQQPVVQRDTVPLQIPQAQIKSLQRTLNRRGFSVGKVDGLWGDHTAAALKRFQAANQLNPTGELDRTTELKLGMIKSGNQVATPALAPAGVAPAIPPAAVVAAPGAAVAVPAQAPLQSGTAMGKQPKATSGANSFTKGQAQSRIEGDGYQNVHDLALDSQGIWRGTASKNGQTVHVWLDYQGDVGQQ